MANPGTNCVASIDDGEETFNLSAGTYTLVLTAYDGEDDIPGDFGYTIEGPAAVQLGPRAPTTVTPVPTLSEWTLALLAAGAGALGMRRLSRRRRR